MRPLQRGDTGSEVKSDALSAPSTVEAMAAPAPADDFRSSVVAMTGERPERRPFPLAREARRRVRDIRAARSAAETVGHAWVPGEASMLSEDEWRELIQWYVVVDDYDEDTAVLSITPWPTLDSRQRLIFRRERTTERDVVLGALLGFLAANRCQFTPEGLMVSAFAGDEREMRLRPIRVGDVFAFSDTALISLAAGEPGVGSETPVVVDVSASGREAAKIAFYAAATRPINPRRERDRELTEIARQTNTPE